MCPLARVASSSYQFAAHADKTDLPTHAAGSYVHGILAKQQCHCCWRETHA